MEPNRMNTPTPISPAAASDTASRVAPQPVRASVSSIKCGPQRVESHSPHRLSPREAQIVSLAYRTNAEIAQLLGLSPYTVKCHMQNALRRLNCETRTAAYAVLSGKAAA